MINLTSHMNQPASYVKRSWPVKWILKIVPADVGASGRERTEKGERGGEISSEIGGPWLWSRILFTCQFTGFASGQRTLQYELNLMYLIGSTCSVRPCFFGFGASHSINSKLAVTYPYDGCDLRDTERSICLQIFTLTAWHEVLTITILPLN